VAVIHVVVFWVMILCNDVVGYQYFEGTCCLHLQGELTGTGKGVCIYIYIYKQEV
jgi:hypothetical protein